MTQRFVKFRDSSPHEDEIEELRLNALQSLNSNIEDENEDELRRKALESINKKVITHLEQNQISRGNKRNDSESTDCVDERDSDSDDDFVVTVNKVASTVVCTGLTRTIRNQNIKDNAHAEDPISRKRRRRKKSPSIHSSDFSFLSSEDEDTGSRIPDLRNKLEKRGIFRHRDVTTSTDNKINLDNQTSDEDFENLSQRTSITFNDVTVGSYCKSRDHRSKPPASRFRGNRVTLPRKERTSVKDRLGWSKKSRKLGGRRSDRNLDEKIKKISQKNRQIVERRKMINNEIEQHKMHFDSPVTISNRLSARVSR